MSKPLTNLLTGMNKEEREEFTKSWNNARWLTDPMRKVLLDKRERLIHDIIYEDFDTQRDDRAEVRVIDQFIAMLPGEEK